MRVLRSRILVLSMAGFLPLATACEGDTADEAVVVSDTALTTTAAAPAAAQLPPDLEQRSQAWMAAWNGSDPAAVAEFFTEDARAVVDDSTFTGRAAIERGWLANNVPAVSNLQATDESVRQSGSDWVASGRHSYTAQPPEGEAEQGSGSHEVTWSQGPDGTWRIRSITVRGDM